MTRPSPLVIAVDGPSASGKGTLARQLAAHYGLRHLDTGSLYRAVGLSMHLAGHSVFDAVGAACAARALDLSLLHHPLLRSEVAGQAASIVSSHPGVRIALLALQRDFAADPPGAVLDGRDIGTVICPKAHAKLYITADVTVRARRREQELIACQQPQPYETILHALKERDTRDSTRHLAPLRPAEDALLLDTSNLDIAGALAEAVRLIDSKLAAF